METTVGLQLVSPQEDRGYLHFQPPTPTKSLPDYPTVDRSEYHSYQHRPAYYRDISQDDWNNWIWQQRAAVRKPEELKKVYPAISETILSALREYQNDGYRIQITPHLWALMEQDSHGNPNFTDPIARQHFPMLTCLVNGMPRETRPDEYDPKQENWETPQEMYYQLQWKYTDRAVLRTTDQCLSYCVHCFNSKQTSEEGEMKGGFQKDWEKIKARIAGNRQLEEIIVSGGEPLLHNNHILEQLLKDIRDLKDSKGEELVRRIRVNTRAFTHNPMRIDSDFAALLKKYRVTALGLHVTHPNEMTADFRQAVQTVRDSGTLAWIYSHSALLKGVNDNAALLRTMYTQLLESGVKPYSLIHCMPNIPGAAELRTPVRRGVELLKYEIGFNMSQMAMPRYYLNTPQGKVMIPDSLNGSSNFIYTKRDDGWPLVRFKNWKDVWVDYLDSPT